MIIDNPYIVPASNKLIEIDKVKRDNINNRDLGKLKKLMQEYEELDKQSRAFVYAEIEKLKETKQEAEENLEYVSKSTNFSSLNKQNTKAIEVRRSIDDLLARSRSVNKMIRNEIEMVRKRNASVRGHKKWMLLYWLLEQFSYQFLV